MASSSVDVRDAATLVVQMLRDRGHVAWFAGGCVRDRLLGEIDRSDVHVHGPAGLDIGAEMPESIALAIVAEIHAFWNRRDGSMLTGPAVQGTD